MTMTLDQALALCEHASPMPHLAGQALRVLRDEIARIKADESALPVAHFIETSPGNWEQAASVYSGQPGVVPLFTHLQAQAAQVGDATAFVVVDAKGKKFTIYNPDLAKAIRSAAKESGSSLTMDAVCTIPDYGWFCTRREGHEGPCAAWPNAPKTTCPTCGGAATRHEVSGAFEMRDEYRHAPTAEPVAQGEVVAGAPSIEAAEAMGARGGASVEAERLAFEAWMRGHCWSLCATWDGAGYRSDAEQGGNICPHAMKTRGLWAAWRDRAALAAQPRAVPAERVVDGWREKFVELLEDYACSRVETGVWNVTQRVQPENGIRMPRPRLAKLMAHVDLLATDPQPGESA